MAQWQSFQNNPFGYLGERLMLVPILGIVLMIVGAVVTFRADALTEKWFPDKPERSATLKMVGLAVVMLGAIRILM
ncbi:MAG: hypothetical protein RR482_02660 [Clostridia bacterium]